MKKLEEALSLVTELHSHSIINKDKYYTDKLLQIIINLSTMDEELSISNSLDNNQDEVDKVKRKVPKWMKKIHQSNYKILEAYMKLSDNNETSIAVSELEEYSEIEPKIFLGHYNAMKTISKKNHAKVFEENHKEVSLWKPVAGFIEELFEGNIMNKKKASLIVNEYLGKEVLNPKNDGNVKFSNKSKTKNVYWLNIRMDSRLSNEFHLILNDEEKREFTHLIIPENLFKTNLFKIRFDEKYKIRKVDMELSYDTHNYLEDIKSGGTHHDFSQYVSKVFKY